jgi:UDP-N-acetyl-D-glucosamine dehydrogenase
LGSGDSGVYVACSNGSVALDVRFGLPAIKPSEANLRESIAFRRILVNKVSLASMTRRRMLSDVFRHFDRGSSMTEEVAVASKKRFNIRCVPATLGQVTEVDLPFRATVLGDFLGKDEDFPLASSIVQTAVETFEARVGVIGLGYVGLPLALTIAKAGFRVSGFDVDDKKIADLNDGVSHIKSIANSILETFTATEYFRASSDFEKLRDCDVIIICVPTPLTKYREPDLSFIEQTARSIAQTLRLGQLIVLESTTYPGTTDEVVKPILEETGLRSGRDFFLGYSPEREDPGNTAFQTSTIAKIVAGDGPSAAALVENFYALSVGKVVPVSSNSTAEAVKLTENIFRAVNIALVNELKIVYDAMGIDIWEVIDAAKTKPFGYMPFYPGPGLGGHCIPIDPFYLTWKSKEYDLPTRFIELAGEINSTMPRYVISKLIDALDRFEGKALSRSRILVVGLAYKKNVADIRESPSLRLLQLIGERDGQADFYDPYISEIPSTREYQYFKALRSIEWNTKALSFYDAIIIATDHSDVDYALIEDFSGVIVDTRNVLARLNLTSQKIVKA